MAKTRAQENRAIRQETLREWLSKKCTGQHLIENIKKIEELDEENPNFANQLNKLRVANEQRLKILLKYLPDLKATEHTGEGGSAIEVDTVVEFIITDAN